MWDGGIHPSKTTAKSMLAGTQSHQVIYMKNYIAEKFQN